MKSATRAIDVNLIKLSANENCYGCSPHAVDAGIKKFTNIYRYPEVHPAALKEKLACKYGVTANNIIIDAGSVRIIDGLIRTFVGENEEVLTFEKSFIAYTELAAFHHRRYRCAPLSDFQCKPANLYPYINDKTRLVFLANPNNPTGTITRHDELERFMATIPSTITVVVDEAYAEYVTDPSFADSLKLQHHYPNLVVLRSFSKIYGLAALRVGYAIMHEQKALRMSLVQIPFSVNSCAASAASAALDDMSFIRHSIKDNAEQRQYLQTELAALGYKTPQSHANFVYIHFDCDHEKKRMKNILHNNGILICDLDNFGLRLALRITVGNKDTNRKIITLLQEDFAYRALQN